MKILKMIFHITLMALLILVMRYCLGLPFNNQMPVERKLGRRQEVVHYKGCSKEITDQYIEKYLVPIDEKIDQDNIVYYNEEEILYSGQGYKLGKLAGKPPWLSYIEYPHTLAQLVEAYPHPILRDCENGYYYAMYHTENDNRLYVFMTIGKSDHNQYMETIGYPIVMTERLQYSDFKDIKKNDKIDFVAEVDPATKLYQNMGKQMPLTTVHLLTDGLLRIKYRVRYGVYLVDEIIFDEDFLEIYQIYEQDYMPEKSRYRRGISYNELYDMDLGNGFRTTSTSYSAGFLADAIQIQLRKYTGKQSQDNISELESVTVGGSTYFYDENCYFYDGEGESGKIYQKRMLPKEVLMTMW